MTLVEEGAMQLTLRSILPWLLQMAMLNLPKLARMILILWSVVQVRARVSPSHR